MRRTARGLAFVLCFVGLTAAPAALATPVTYAIDVEITLDNGIGLAPGSYLAAGTVTADVPAPSPGLVGAAILSLTLTLGGDTWTLADSTSASYALALVDGVATGVLFNGVNGNGHLLSLGFDPVGLSIADLTDVQANHFAIGTYTLAAIPEPGVALLVGFGLLGFAAARRR